MRGDMPVSEPDWHEQLLCDIRQGGCLQSGFRVPIIVISAYDTAEYEAAAKEAGAN